jgi:hypothetical protein
MMTHSCCPGKSKARLTFDRPIKCCAFKLEKVRVKENFGARRNSQSIPQSHGVPVEKNTEKLTVPEVLDSLCQQQQP